MADEYTPTTGEVRHAWINYGRRPPDVGAFNRWLADYTRKAKAEALREAVAYARPVDGDHVGMSRDEAIGFEEALQLVIDYAAGIGDDQSFLAFWHVSSADEKTQPQGRR